MSDIERLREAALKHFGWAELTAEQMDAMAAVMAGRDVLAVLPTGAGKSAIYQVPALLLDGLCVVVSPLIALQRDQRAALSGQGMPDAVVINSTQRAKERDRAWQAVEEGTARYLFLSPEQLASPQVVERIAAVGVAVLTVDEAHCVSEWGHDFRPDYLRLGDVVDRLGHPRVIALTATAAAPVRADVVARLHLRDHHEVIAGFDRPNLQLSAHLHADTVRRDAAVIDRVVQLEGCGLVYVATRKAADQLAAQLTARGRKVRAYHAGRRRADRDADQEAFMTGEVDVIVATSAFGMGVDKPDVRFVLHAAAPASIDAYYQEIGRGGRDGTDTVVELHHHADDHNLQRFLTARRPRPAALRAVLDVLADGRTVSHAELGAATGLSRARRTSLLNLLEEAGAVRIDSEGVTSTGVPRAEGVAAAVAVAERRRETVRSRIEMMRSYADSCDCRRITLLGYFGEPFPGSCNGCDNCSSTRARSTTGPAAGRPRDPDAVETDLVAGSAVTHPEFGPGTVMSVEADRATVLFAEHGYKTIALRAQDLLEPATA